MLYGLGPLAGSSGPFDTVLSGVTTIPQGDYIVSGLCQLIWVCLESMPHETGAIPLHCVDSA